jgi:hypothetical protein
MNLFCSTKSLFYRKHFESGGTEVGLQVPLPAQTRSQKQIFDQAPNRQEKHAVLELLRIHVICEHFRRACNARKAFSGAAFQQPAKGYSATMGCRLHLFSVFRLQPFKQRIFFSLLQKSLSEEGNASPLRPQ